MGSAILPARPENYNEDKFRFEFKTFGARNQALKLLERAGFDYELVEDLDEVGKVEVATARDRPMAARATMQP